MFHLKNLKIGKQFLLMTSFFSLLLVATAGIGYFGISELGQKSYSAITAEGMIAQSAANITILALELRRYEKDSFLNIDKPEKVATYQQKWEQSYSNLSANFDELSRLLKGSAQTGPINKMKRAAIDYRNGIKKVWEQMADGRISDPAAGNQAIKIYKQAIRSLIETSFTISKETNQKLEETPTILSRYAQQKQWLMGLSGLIALLAMNLGGFFMARNITAPTRKLVDMIHDMEKGHLGKRLNLQRKDEIGAIAKAMNRFSDSLEKEVITALQQLSQGDLTFDIKPHDTHDLLRGALNDLCRDLNGTMKTIQDAAAQINSGACQVADSSTSLSQGATESAASLEEISASITEISSQTSSSAENANQANILSDQARKAAEEGSTQMEEMVIAMGEINEAGQSI
ncbi:MAG: methyl-accepting chemotaxis protein, partial [Geopsychrobacter sp.]|nr:methyl-accepting chemotaxis protein [Geopsychrobacter sp.]